MSDSLHLQKSFVTKYENIWSVLSESLTIAFGQEKASMSSLYKVSSYLYS